MTAKKKNLFKALAASLFAVCLFSVGFILLNDTVFAITTDLPPDTTTSTNTGESILPTSAEIIIENSLRPPNERAAVGDFVVPNLNVIEAAAMAGECEATGAPSSLIERSPGALSAQEAAIIGAEYIWDLFGISIDGKDVRMQYIQAPDRIRPYWFGSVVLPKALLCTDGYVLGWMEVPESPNHATTFLLDVVTGERIGIERPVEHLGIFRPGCLSWGTVRVEGIDSPIPVEEIVDLPAPPRFTEVAEETARIFAQRHFSNPDVRVIHVAEHEFSRTLDKNPAGDIVVTPRAFFASAKDGSAREARFQFIIHEFEAVLIELETQHNDFVPLQ